jgi:hypothetical protein
MPQRCAARTIARGARTRAHHAALPRCAARHNRMHPPQLYRSPHARCRSRAPTRPADAPPPSSALYPPPSYGANPYAAYPGYYPPPPPPKAAASSAFPPWMWVALGVGLAGLASKLMEGAKSKQADIQQAMMQQMLKSMMGGAGGAGGMPGMPPGGMPAGFPGMPPPGFGGAAPPRPAAGAAPGAAARAAPVDTTATPVTKARLCGSASQLCMHSRHARAHVSL